MRALFLALALIAGAASAQEGLGAGVGEGGGLETAPSPGARPVRPEGGSDRLIDRKETGFERQRREEGISTFDSRGRIRSQPEQIRRAPEVTTDRLRRSQRPDYSAGPGVNIIRRQP